MANSLKLFNETIANPKTQNYLATALADKKQSFVSNITALVSNSAVLQDCDPLSILYAGMRATSLDLPLDASLGMAFVLPYNDKKKGKVAVLQLGYKAYLQLAIRSGQFKTINAREVRQGEIESEDFVSGELRFRMLTKDREKAPIIGYVAYFRLVNGFEKMLYMTVEELNAHGKKYSKSFQAGYGLWKDEPDAMMKKSVIKLLLSRYAPLSVEMANAIKSDSALITEKGEEYVDNDNAASVSSEQSAKAADILAAALKKETQKNNADIEEAQLVDDTLNNDAVEVSPPVDAVEVSPPVTEMVRQNETKTKPETKKSADANLTEIFQSTSTEHFMR
jgi:recombination protein RecT